MSAMAAIYVDVSARLARAFRSRVPLLYCKATGAGESSRNPAGRHSRRRALHQVGGGRLQLMFSRNRLTTRQNKFLLI